MAAPSIPFPMQLDTIKFGEAELYRWLDDVFDDGVLDAASGVVSQNGGGSLSVNVAAGEAIVAFTTPYGGKRRCVWTATTSGLVGAPTTGDNWTASFTTPDGTNPRLDRVIVTVQDASLDATGQRRMIFKVVPGTPAAGATLVNLTGATAVPVNSLLLANVLVRAGATTILTADIDTSVATRLLAKVGGGRLAQFGIAVDEQEVVADTTFTTASTEAAPLTVVTFAPQTFDGVSKYWIDVSTGQIHSNAGVTNGALAAWQGTANELPSATNGRVLKAPDTAAASDNYNQRGQRRLTPPAGTYSILLRGWAVGASWILKGSAGNPLVARLYRDL